jgi:hypothetical protein
MSPTSRLAGFAAIVVAVFALGWGLGAALGTDGSDDDAPAPSTTVVADDGPHADHVPTPTSSSTTSSSTSSTATAGGAQR